MRRRVTAAPSTGEREAFFQDNTWVVFHMLTLTAFHLPPLRVSWEMAGGFFLENVLQRVFLFLHPSHRVKAWQNSEPGAKHCTTQVLLSLWEVISPRGMAIFCFLTVYQAKVGPTGPAGSMIYTTIGKIPLRGRYRPHKAPQPEDKHTPVDFCTGAAHKQSFRISYQWVQSLSL